ncbi:MAG: RtcB family protein [Bacteroidia bacterium]|nr:RtcB family protein [Bacteroidia bacterium]
MKKLQISGKELRAIGFSESPAIPMIMEVVNKHYKFHEMEEVLTILNALCSNPESFESDELFGKVAAKLTEPKVPDTIALKDPVPFTVYGQGEIEEGAMKQMETAVRLPVAVSGALMPDAHQGYGLPIGGVLATRNAVIPYGVGVDIGCRMCLSIYDIPAAHLDLNLNFYKRELIAFTKFGAGNAWKGKELAEHSVLEHPTFGLTKMLKHLYDKAAVQLGTSGGGNHFVEFGKFEMLADDKDLGIPKGEYLALLSHSGSRGFGATVAGHYTKLARELCVLPREASHLAYLDLDSEAGMEYWLAMNLAGEYASACHEVIHQKLTKAIGANLLGRVENHHNFAWKETHNGEDVVVHRKGATPAAKGVLGIIPGSMTAPGFLVRGKGAANSLDSAAHGAGRRMSRTAANNSIPPADFRAVLKDHGVTLIGGGLDEAPMAYKDIHKVMAAQSDLVEVLAQFTPKLVRMADDGSRED